MSHFSPTEMKRTLTEIYSPQNDRQDNNTALLQQVQSASV